MRWVVLGRFHDEEALCQAGKALRELRYLVDLHSPIPLEGTSEALALKPSRVRVMALLGGLLGAIGGYVVPWFTNAVDFPINVGGRPLNSGPAFIPLTFEAMVLSAALAIFGSFLAICGLPKLYHPAFEVKAFEETSIDAFWLSLLVEGPREAAEHAAGHVREAGATAVSMAEDRSLLEVRV